jgi:hypothetical protein
MNLKRVALTLLVMALGGWALAQSTRPASPELISRQALIKDQFDRLAKNMAEIAQIVKKTDPKTAATLEAALDEAKRANVEGDMDKVIENLNKGLSLLAGRREDDVLEKLADIMRILKSGPGEVTSDDITRMQKALEEINKLRNDQQDLNDRTKLATQGEKMAQRMRELAGQLDNIIKQQEELLSKSTTLPEGDQAVRKLVAARDEVRALMAKQAALTEAASKANIGQMLVQGEDQKALGQRAGKAVESIGQLGKDAALSEALAQAGADAKTAQSASEQVGQAAKAMGQAGKDLSATQAEQAAPNQATAGSQLAAADKTLSDAIDKLTAATAAGKLSRQQNQLAQQTGKLSQNVKDAVAASGVKNPGDSPASSPAASAPSSAPASSPAPSGGQKSNLDRAAEHMDNAAQKLTEQDKKDASANMEKALAEMKGQVRKLGELERKVQEEAKKVRPEQNVAEQKDNSQRTEKLSQDMQQEKNGKQVPGNQAVGSAAKKMESAAGKMSNSDSSAGEDQQQSVADLDRAKDELEKAIEEAKQQLQNQALAKIETMLREMLQAQQALSKSTIELEGKKPAGGEFDRPQLAKLGEVTDAEGKLAGRSGEVLDLVKKEGTTVVFPLILEKVKTDLLSVQKLLADKQTGRFTQSVQKEVEDSLAQLIAALQAEQRKRKGGGGGGKGGGGKAPLVPPEAELRMLRMMQLQINGRTQEINGALKVGGISQAEHAVQAKLAGEREAAVKKMTEDLAAKAAKGDN